MIKFEEHEGKLFRMLDKPTPLTPDAEMPCLVRLTQDDSPMGRYNQNLDKSALHTIEMCIGIDRQYQYILSGSSLHYARYEVIGYPVSDGSNEWALYQMMQGLKVCNPQLAKSKAARLGCDDETFNTYWYVVGDTVVEGKGDYGTLSVSSWIAAASSTGWEIYAEPKPGLKYKAGDFVEIINWYSGTKHLGQIDSIDHEIHMGTHRFDISGKSVMERVPQLSIIHKLKPSEVIVNIGCLSGTVKRSQYHKLHFILVTKAGNCYIKFDALDKETREFVESLLKAQEEE